jgi:enterochelin esterase family protein
MKRSSSTHRRQCPRPWRSNDLPPRLERLGVAWERPAEFRNVISLIGSFTNIRSGHVYPELVKTNERKPLRVFIQDGVNDNRNAKDVRLDWHVQNQAMVSALEEKGYDAKHIFGDGGHADDHGGALLPEILRWIWRDYLGVLRAKKKD